MASLPLPPGASDSFQLDLKGVLYDATVLPLAGTAMVVNIGPTSAKVWCDVWAECGKKCEHMGRAQVAHAYARWSLGGVAAVIHAHR